MSDAGPDVQPARCDTAEMRQDDAPPEGVVEVMCDMVAAHSAMRITPEMAALMLKGLRISADRQALAEWIAPEGMVLVPREPTEAMRMAGNEAWGNHAVPREIWHAMLAAAKDSG